jgi:hypothetical protein
MPSATTAATAGSSFCASSPRPNSPFSPACGLMPQTAIRGASRPPLRSASAPSRITRSTRSGSIASIASISPMWVVTWITRSFGVVSIIA